MMKNARMHAKFSVTPLALTVLLCAALSVSCAPDIYIEREVDAYTVDITVRSRAIEKNRIGDKSLGAIRVILPPGYADSAKRYPVIYFLHGYGDSIYQMSGYYFAIEEAMKSGASAEFIIVNVNGTNKLGGSFYDNSPIIGNWRDYVVKEVVPIIDLKFRTKKASESRGIAGFSMGGYGALNIALKNPDVFGALWVIGPGLLRDGDLPRMLAQWDSSVRKAYASVYAYDLALPKPWIQVPALDGSAEDAAIVSKWYSGYGDIAGKIVRYLELKDRLRAISINYGAYDSYVWLVDGCVALDQALAARGVSHEFRSWEMGHSFGPIPILDGMLPFFTKNLE